MHETDDKGHEGRDHLFFVARLKQERRQDLDKNVHHDIHLYSSNITMAIAILSHWI